MKIHTDHKNGFSNSYHIGGARMSEGCYLLRTNLTETDPATLWKRYIQLTEAEWAIT